MIHSAGTPHHLDSAGPQMNKTKSYIILEIGIHYAGKTLIFFIKIKKCGCDAMNNKYFYEAQNSTLYLVKKNQ